MKNNKTDATNVLKFFREAKEAKRGGQNNLDVMGYGGTDDPPKKTNHLGSLDDPIKRPGYKFVKMNGNSGRWVKKESMKSILDSQKIIKGKYSALSKKNK
jgi:hypothetical protein